MTEGPAEPKHLAGKPAAPPKAPAPKPTTVNWWKLSVAIGLTALGYGLALRPVMASVASLQGFKGSQLAKQLKALARQNAAKDEQLRKEAAQLQSTLAKENALRAEIATVEAQKPPPIASVAVPGVSVPTVHTTSGASGIP